MDLKERTLLFHREKPFHAPRELLRRDDDGERAERIIPLERVDFRNEGVFKIGAELTGDDREHDRIRLAELSERNKNGRGGRAPCGLLALLGRAQRLGPGLAERFDLRVILGQHARFD